MLFHKIFQYLAPSYLGVKFIREKLTLPIYFRTVDIDEFHIERHKAFNEFLQYREFWSR